ncbi:MAG TPA: hypothetical protein VF331_09845 [Polyangiales bacterium]
MGQFEELSLELVRARRRTWLLGCAALLGLLLCFDTPLLRFFFTAVLGFGWFRQSPRLLLLVQLALVLVAALGLDSLEPLLRRHGRAFLWVGAMACAVAFGDSALRIGWRLQDARLAELVPTSGFHEALAQASSRGGRVAAIGRRVLPYGLSGWYGIDLINGYSGLTLKHWVEYFSILRFGSAQDVPRRPVIWTDLDRVARPDLLRALNVERIVAEQELPLPAIGFHHLGSFTAVPAFLFYKGPELVNAQLYAADVPLGPAYFASEVSGVRAAQSLATLVADKSPLHAHVVELDVTTTVATATGHATMVARSADRFDYDTRSDRDGFLIVAQVWYPGWKLTIDGVSARLYRTNHALIGAWVPGGRHRLRLTMTSPALRLGVLLCASAAFNAAMFVLQGWFRSRRMRVHRAYGSGPQRACNPSLVESKREHDWEHAEHHERITCAADQRQQRGPRG